MLEEMTRSYRRYRALLFVVLGACYFIVLFHRNALSVVAVDMMEDTSVQAALMGLFVRRTLLYMFIQLPTGLLSDS